jgi:hypothetical protein
MWVAVAVLIGAVNITTLVAGILLFGAVSEALARRGLWVGRVGGAVSVAPFAYALLLAFAGIVKAFVAVGSESDPSQKARALAEGISEWMNCSALGALLVVPAGVILLLRRALRIHSARSAEIRKQISAVPDATVQFVAPRVKYTAAIAAATTLAVAGVDYALGGQAPPWIVPCAVLASVIIGWLISATQTIEVSHDGIVLYGVNRVSWGDITGAHLRRFVGLEYLNLLRARGRSWWLPLFFVGDDDIRSVLQRLAPEGHPVRACLDSARRIKRPKSTG